MTLDTVVDIARQTVTIIVIASAPMLLVSLIVGLLISIFQTVTSIQEQTLTFVPKLLAMFLVLILTFAWMTTMIRDYFIQIVSSITNYV